MTLTLLRIAGSAVAAFATVGFAAAAAQDRPAKPARPAAPAAADRARARAIWPSGLEQIAGRYSFAQVSSPGGLWDRFTPKEGPSTVRQVALPHLPAELREKLLKAELIISDLKLPTEIEGQERVSPSKRGKLRFYNESAAGRLTLHSLPGVGGVMGCGGEYTGPVIFEIEHRSHSNPSVTGVLSQRVNEERTWGAATLDSAGLSATAYAPDAKPDAEGMPILTNARILRSGVEVFAFVEWAGDDAEGRHEINGSVRLARVKVLTTQR